VKVGFGGIAAHAGAPDNEVYKLNLRCKEKRKRRERRRDGKREEDETNIFLLM